MNLFPHKFVNSNLQNIDINRFLIVLNKRMQNFSAFGQVVFEIHRK